MSAKFRMSMSEWTGYGRRDAGDMVTHAPVGESSRGRGWAKATPAKTIKPKESFIIGLRKESVNCDEKSGIVRGGEERLECRLGGKATERERVFPSVFMPNSFDWYSSVNVTCDDRTLVLHISFSHTPVMPTSPRY